jgi:hypothetical protein
VDIGLVQRIRRAGTWHVQDKMTLLIKIVDHREIARRTACVLVLFPKFEPAEASAS